MSKIATGNDLKTKFGAWVGNNEYGTDLSKCPTKNEFLGGSSTGKTLSLSGTYSNNQLIQIDDCNAIAIKKKIYITTSNYFPETAIHVGVNNIATSGLAWMGAPNMGYTIIDGQRCSNGTFTWGDYLYFSWNGDNESYGLFDYVNNGSYKIG